jgi:hypothetical protein
MRLLQLIGGALLALTACPAAADPWQVAGERFSVPATGLSFPARAATLSLFKTGAVPNAEGVDNVAQLKSPDEAVFATVFVYLPAYADAALAAWELDKVIRAHMGPDPRLAASAVVPAGGNAAGAIRRVYVNAADGKLATGAALLRAGHWIAVIRVSGPMERRAEVEAGLDALVAGLTASQGVKVDPIAELQVSDCPAVAAQDAKRTQLSLGGVKLSNDPMTRMLIDSTLASGFPRAGHEKEPPFPASIADNGRRPVCIREHVRTSDNVIDMMQAAGDTALPEAVIGIVNDAGRTIEMRRGDMGGVYMLRIHDVARTSHFGAYDRPLSAAQLAALLRGDPKLGALRSQTEYKADGTFGTTVFIATGK